MFRQCIKPIHKIVLIVPIILWGMFEVFIDPFPNSLWLVRFLSTQYLVTVRADLEVEGEALKLERTFRCFRPYDYKWLASESTARDWPTNGQAGDIIAAETSKGRLFAISIPMACGIMSDWTVPFGPVANPNELVLSRDEIRTPVVFEVHGGNKVERIDAYISRNKLREGYHGVKLKDFKLSREPGLLWDDSNGYDWVGPANWTRPQIRDLTHYMAGFLMAVPESRWDETDHAAEFLSSAKYLAEMPKSYSEFIDQYRSSPHNTVIQTNRAAPNPFNNLMGKFLYQYPRNTPAFYELDFPREEMIYDSYKLTQWAEDYIIPCTGDEYGTQFNCFPNLAGVLIYSQLKLSRPRGLSDDAIFQIGEMSFNAEQRHAHLIDRNNGIVYTSQTTMSYWRK